MSHFMPTMSGLFEIVLLLLTLAFLLCFVRLWRGPSLPDRVVALDLMTVLAVGILATFAMQMDQPVFLDVAIVLALITFLATIAFARYVEKRTEPRVAQEDET